MSEPIGQAILTFMEVMSPTKLLAPLINTFQTKQEPPTEYVAVVRSDQAPDLFSVTTGLPVERRMSIWKNASLVSSEYHNAPRMGPTDRRSEMVLRGMGFTERYPGETGITRDEPTVAEVRNTLGRVGSATSAGLGRRVQKKAPMY